MNINPLNSHNKTWSSPFSTSNMMKVTCLTASALYCYANPLGVSPVVNAVVLVATTCFLAYTNQKCDQVNVIGSVQTESDFATNNVHGSQTMRHVESCVTSAKTLRAPLVASATTADKGAVAAKAKAIRQIEDLEKAIEEMGIPSDLEAEVHKSMKNTIKAVEEIKVHLAALKKAVAESDNIDELETQIDGLAKKLLFALGINASLDMYRGIKEFQANEPSRLAQEAISHLPSLKSDFSRFNSAIDRLRTKPNWQATFTDKLKELKIDFKKLAHMHPIDLRGYDREALQLVFEAAINTTDGETDKLWALRSQLAVKILDIDACDIKTLGKGAVNQVSILKYVEDGKEVQAVFKPDGGKSPLIELKEQFWGTATASGIPVGDSAHSACRAVASAKVDRLMNSVHPISVDTTFAIVNGERGILMQLATGANPKIIGEKHALISLKNHRAIKASLKAELKNEGKLSARSLKSLARLLKYRRIELVEGLKPGKIKLRGTIAEFAAPTETSRPFNPLDPITLEGLISLQVLDVINGEVDRHPKNYFIDETGQVMGIDQDCSFGLDSIPEGTDVRAQTLLMGIIPNKGSLMLRMPPVVTQSIKERIIRLHGNAAALRETLAALIEEKEIDATLVRLQKLKDHVENNCLVVADKAGLITPEALKLMDTNNSYAMRELLVYSQDEEGWNYLRKHRDF